LRVLTPAVIDRITVYHTLDPQPSKLLLDLKLGEQNQGPGV